MHFFQGGSRLRFTHLDHLSIASDIVLEASESMLLPREGSITLIFREIIRPSIFKAKLIEYI